MALTDTVRAVLDHKGVGVCAVGPETPVYEALEIMADKDIGALLVMEEADLCGVFSERDYARKLILQGKASRDTTVGEIMTSPPICATLEQSVDDCLRVMTDRRVRHLPVVSQQAVIGVLSIGDLVNWVIRRQEEEIHHLHHYIAGTYPA
ncbi:MAG: CBS domain-containing protein [Acidobacteriota bacterium]|nr:CBS domain-containing protein [Acidobacteriota bacterium]